MICTGVETDFCVEEGEGSGPKTDQPLLAWRDSVGFKLEYGVWSFSDVAYGSHEVCFGC